MRVWGEAWRAWWPRLSLLSHCCQARPLVTRTWQEARQGSRGHLEGKHGPEVGGEERTWPVLWGRKGEGRLKVDLNAISSGYTD